MNEGRHCLKPGAQGGRLGQPLRHRLGSMKGEDFARAGLGIAAIGEARNDARALIYEGQWVFIIYPFERRAGITGGLVLNGRDLVPPILGLGFYDANGLLIHEQNIIGGPDICLIFAHGDAQRSVEINSLLVLNDPACLYQTFVNLIAGLLLRILVWLGHSHISFAKLVRAGNQRFPVRAS